MIETVQNNLSCLLNILKFNVENNILFFRITSDLIPFASHLVNQFDWNNYFKDTFSEIGHFVKAHNVRISMHPDQFIVLNSPDEGVFKRSVAEIHYHAQVLDAMNLGNDAKIQLHVGGVYGDKQRSIERFASRFSQLPNTVKKRLVIENDDRLYTVRDCMNIHAVTGIPILFDTFHHQINGSAENFNEAINLVIDTWKPVDGILMVDYSSQSIGYRKGNHAESIDLNDFEKFLKLTSPYDFDIMLEIKDKEASALKAVQLVSNNPQFNIESQIE